MLPQSVRVTIMAPKTLDALYEIGENNSLGQEQIHKLVRYTDVILAGIVPIKLFRNTLSTVLTVIIASLAIVGFDEAGEIASGEPRTADAYMVPLFRPQIVVPEWRKQARHHAKSGWLR